MRRVRCVVVVMVVVVVAFGGFAPEELEEASVAAANLVCADGCALETLDGEVDHVADREAFFICHGGC